MEEFRNRFTVEIIAIFNSIAVYPTADRDKVGDKTGDVAFDQHVVADNDMSGAQIDLVLLRNN